MRLPAISLFFVAAVGCSSSSDPIPPGDVFVDELSTADQANLCEDFLDAFCAVGSPQETFCDDQCIDEGCLPVAENGGFDDECGPGDVTVDEVLACGDTAEEPECGIGGTNSPGCMADALVAACP